MAINDFGEKIGGAKKDLWKERGMIISDLSEMNDAEKRKLITKDNVWQKVDYQALVDDGVPVKVAWFIKKVRDSLGAKPALDYFDTTPERVLDKQEKFIEFVGVIRDAVMGCKTEDDILKISNKSWLVENGFVEAGSSWSVRPTEKAGGMITNKFLKAFFVKPYDLVYYDNEIKKKQFLYSNEQKILSKYDIYKYANVTWDKDYSDRTVIKVPVPGGTAFIYPTNELMDKESWVEGSYFVRNRGTIIGRNFESLEAAQKFVVDKDANKPIDGTKKRKGRFVPPQLAHIKREGDEVRCGRHMTGQDYLDTFNFKGGEFGNWMSEKDRQASLDMGYDALYDLAKALKVDFKDISLNNELSIAFGARGSGSALAHYEPLRQVINLTKMRGAGSLAHEWAHALDDILGKGVGLSGFMTESKRSSKVPESLKVLLKTMTQKTVCDEATKEQSRKLVEYYKHTLRSNVNYLFPEGKMSDAEIGRKEQLVEQLIADAGNPDAVGWLGHWAVDSNQAIVALSNLRKEVFGRVIPKESREQFAQLQYSLHCRIESVDEAKAVDTDFYANSKKFDKDFSKTDNGYWSSSVEMFARAFSCYVLDKIRENDGCSDYLCGHSEIHKSFDSKGNPVCAFPVGEERVAINKCFDDLIQELKDKGLLHHKEDFTVEERLPERHEPTIEWKPGEVEESYQMSFMDLLDNAYERAGEQGDTGKQIGFDLDKEI